MNWESMFSGNFAMDGLAIKLTVSYPNDKSWILLTQCNESFKKVKMEYCSKPINSAS